MKKRRVVVTGMGAVTAIGVGLNEFWEGLITGRNGVDLITRFDTTNFETKFAAEVKNNKNACVDETKRCSTKSSSFVVAPTTPFPPRRWERYRVVGFLLMYPS